MSLPLPCGDYEFLENGADEFQSLVNYFDEVERSHQEKREPPQWSSHFKDESRGYFIEADVLYPPERHHMMRDYPPCPTATEFKEEDTSPYYREAWHVKNGDRKMPNSTKLCASLVDKRNVVLHSEAPHLVNWFALLLLLKKSNLTLCPNTYKSKKTLYDRNHFSGCFKNGWTFALRSADRLL